MRPGLFASREASWPARTETKDTLRLRLKPGSVLQRLTLGTAYSLAGSAANRGANLAASIYVARILGPHAFGQYVILQSTVGLFQVFANFGLSATAAKYVSQYRTSDPERASRIVAVSVYMSAAAGLTVFVAMIATAQLIADRALGAPDIGPLVRIVAIATLLGSINAVQIGTLSGVEAFRSLARIELVTAMVSVPAKVVLAHYFGLTGAAVSLVVAGAVSCLVSHVVAARQLKLAGIPGIRRPRLSDAKGVWGFSLAALLSGLLVSPVLWVCNAIVATQVDGFRALALYGVGNQWRAALLFVPSILSRVSLPILSSTAHSRTLGQHHRALNASLAMVLLLTAAPALILAGASPLLLPLYGAEYGDAHVPMVLLVLSCVPVAAASVFGQAVASRGRMWRNFLLNGAWAVQMIVFTLLLRSYGAAGFAAATLLAYLSHGIASYFIAVGTRLPAGESSSTHAPD